MTEGEWLTATDPHAMLHAIERQVSVRKLRQFGVACCRRAWPLLVDERSRLAVERFESFVERGEATPHEWKSVRLQAWSGECEVHLSGTLQEYRAATAVRPLVADATSRDEVFANTFSVHFAVASAVAPHLQSAAHRAELEEHAAVLRDIVGNPFRPAVFDPSWRTSTAFALATGFHDALAFDTLAVMADALQDAGCEDPDILNHLRGDGPHVRGCWALDLVLGKE